VVQPAIPNAGSLLILAVDMTGDRSLRDYSIDEGEDAVVEDPLVFLAQADSLILTDTFAREHGIAVGTKIPLDTMEGRKQFTVRGIMKSGGLTSAFGGNLAVMDVYAAQKVFGRGRSFDRIDLAAEEGVRVDDLQRKLEAALGPTFTVEAPGARGQQFESLSRVYGMTANITSVFALFIGVFIIFNTLSIAVTQRRREIGILRALGATGGQIRTLFLTESAALGLVGSLVGIALGIVIATGFASSLASVLEDLYGVAQRAEEVAAEPRLLLFALGIGIASSVIAGWMPARNAAGTDPVKALQKGRQQVVTAGENRLRRIVALILAAAAVASVYAGQISRPLFYLGYVMAILAALLLTPTLAMWIAKLLRPVMRLLRPVEGTLAADSLIQAPRRTSGTVAALMLSLALVVSLGGLSRASYNSIRTWVNSALNPDFLVVSSEKLTRRDFLFPASVGEELQRIEGVREVQSVRSGRITFDGGPVLLLAIDLLQAERTSPLPVVSGNPAEMWSRASRGECAIVADNLASLRGYEVGRVLEIPSPSGILRLPVCGIVTDYSDQQGSILIDLSVYARWWRDDRLNSFRVFVTEGADKAEVRQRILDRLAQGRRLFVLTNEQVRSYVTTLTDQWFSLTYIQIAVAVLVAILGIVNSLTVSITDRRRELGILQATGGLRSQVRMTVWLEAMAIGAVGLILGLALGALQLYYTLQVTHRDVAGMRLGYEYPAGVALVLLPVMLGSAFIAAVGPAEAAVRGSLVEALEYE
jgi:putative ABC transport system permease protein